MGKDSYDKTLFEIEDGVLKDYLKKDDECDCVEIPACVKEIAANAFNCSKMRSVKFLGDTEAIGAYAFTYCRRLERVTLPRNLRTLGPGAFDSCWRLKKIRVPGSVKRIERRTFGWCTYLGEIEIEDGVEEIDYDFILDTRIKRLRIPASVKKIAPGAFKETDVLCEIEVDEENDSFALKDGLLYSKDGTRLLWCPRDREGEVLVCDGVETVDDGAFAHCRVERVTLPDTVTEIGSEAFECCWLMTSVTLPDTLTKIGWWAFAYCQSLTSVTLPYSVTEIGGGAFKGCNALKEIALPEWLETLRPDVFSCCRSLERVKLPRGLKRIQEGAFRLCESLNFLAIPASAEKLDDRFASSKGLTSVAFEDPFDWTYIDRNGKEKVADPFVLMDPPNACLFLKNKSHGMTKKRVRDGDEAEL